MNDEQMQTQGQAPASVAAGASNSPSVEEDEKFFAALGYFGFLFVVPLVAKPKSQYCRFHAKQSMVLFLAFFIALIILATFHLFGSLIMIVLFATYVLAIFRAYKGDLWNIPLVSAFAGKMNVDALYHRAGLAVSGIAGLKEKAQDFASKASQSVKDMGDPDKDKSPPAPSAPPPTAQPPN